MRREEMTLELQVWAIVLLMAFALAASLTYNVRLRDRVALQQQRIQNLQGVVLALPADLRRPDGSKTKPPTNKEALALLEKMDQTLALASQALYEARK